MNKLLYIKANCSMLNMPGPDIRPLSISGQISGNIFFLYLKTKIPLNRQKPNFLKPWYHSNKLVSIHAYY